MDVEMSEREKAVRIVELAVKLRQDVVNRPDCGPCIAVKLRRLKTEVDNMYADYEEYLDG